MCVLNMSLHKPVRAALQGDSGKIIPLKIFILQQLLYLVAHCTSQSHFMLQDDTQHLSGFILKVVLGKILCLK